MVVLVCVCVCVCAFVNKNVDEHGGVVWCGVEWGDCLERGVSLERVCVSDPFRLF